MSFFSVKTEHFFVVNQSKSNTFTFNGLVNLIWSCFGNHNPPNSCLFVYLIAQDKYKIKRFAPRMFDVAVLCINTTRLAAHQKTNFDVNDVSRCLAQLQNKAHNSGIPHTLTIKLSFRFDCLFLNCCCWADFILYTKKWLQIRAQIPSTAKSFRPR